VGGPRHRRILRESKDFAVTRRLLLQVVGSARDRIEQDKVRLWERVGVPAKNAAGFTNPSELHRVVIYAEK
jgi:hypothetical protein